jgi:hypothetical protein
MADSVVNVLLQQLPQLIEGASFPSEVEDEVKSFQRELERINIFLENSDGKRNEHKNVKALVRQITEVAYEAEDVIDTFIVKVADQRKRNILGQIIYSIPHAKMLHDVRKKIEGLNKEINKIYDNIEKYGIERAETSVDATTKKALHRRRRYVEEDDVVGFLHDSDTLVKQLTHSTKNSNLMSFQSSAWVDWEKPLLLEKFTIMIVSRCTFIAVHGCMYLKISKSESYC